MCSHPARGHGSEDELEPRGSRNKWRHISSTSWRWSDKEEGRFSDICSIMWVMCAMIFRATRRSPSSCLSRLANLGFPTPAELGSHSFLKCLSCSKYPDYPPVQYWAWNARREWLSITVLKIFMISSNSVFTDESQGARTSSTDATLTFFRWSPRW